MRISHTPTQAAKIIISIKLKSIFKPFLDIICFKDENPLALGVTLAC